MTVSDLVTRFPEIPEDLHGEPILTTFADVFDSLLSQASKPSACTRDHTPEHQYYLKLVGPMDIYRYGLFTRERVLDEIQKLLDAQDLTPDTFAESLLADR
ncbi:MAG: hypothetical protein ACI8V2_000954 [Candidatus Latescibacterota bacterium]|jgi:hypothetical protein